MAYNEITQYNSPNYTPNSQVARIFGYERYIVGVVYHWWGDPNTRPTFEGVISWLCRQGGSSSAHTVGEGGRVAWIVDAINAAWHAGHPRGNAQYVGYECNPRLSDGDYDTMGRFHYDMERAYGRRLEIRVHKEFSSTQCSPINVARIRQIADRHHNPPKPNPTLPVPAAVKLPKPIEFKARFNNAQVWDLTTNPNYKGVKSLKAGEDFLAYAKITFNNATYYVTEYSYGKGLKHGMNAVDLEEKVQPIPDPEWIRNLKWFDEKKLSVIPAEGVKVLDLVTMASVNDNIIPKGTQVDIVGETKIGSQKYYISSYAKTGGKPWGIKADTLGVPAEPPVQEKPEWLKNLQDIDDKDFWTRSETPVLKLEDGSTVETLPINTKVRITHATEIVGNKLLVVDGMQTAIETIYLSDKPIAGPDEDLLKENNTLLKQLLQLVQFIVDKLTNVFK